MLLTRLAELLSESCGFASLSLVGEDAEVTRACFDSRDVQPGDLYCALPGTRSHGEQFIAQAIQAGATAILTSSPGKDDISTLLVNEPNRFARIAGHAAAILAGNPCAALKAVAVTGTNGKSTVVHLLEQAWNQIGWSAGRVGTLGFQFDQEQFDSLNTTPRADLIHHWLGDIKKRGAKAVVVEASSHGIHQGRLAGCEFLAVGWTNLSHDHLDYHKDMEDYAAAKAALILDLPACSTALIPAKDERISSSLAKPICKLLTWSLDHQQADLHALYQPIPAEGGGGLQLQIDGLWGKAHLRSSLLGKHNGENLLLAFGLLCASGLSVEQCKIGLESATAAPGRLQRVASQSPWALFVDYAHTPQALQRVLIALRNAYPESRIGIVCGAGGDRDRHKRAPMGEAAATGADWCMLTSDNPRTEDPLQILQDVVHGAKSAQNEGRCIANHEILTEVDRRVAIQTAVGRLNPGDVLLVAGKGHEPYQEIHGVRHSFDDCIELMEAARCCS